MSAAVQAGATKVLGLFNTSNIDGALDLKFLKKGSVSQVSRPAGPRSTQTTAALAMLSKGGNGFMLMVESGRIDKYSHSLDPERAIYDTIMLDNAVKVAKDFAANRNDTLIIVVRRPRPSCVDHRQLRRQLPGNSLREKLGTSRSRNSRTIRRPMPKAIRRRSTSRGASPSPSAAYPDYCDTGRPYLNGENVPCRRRARNGKISLPTRSIARSPARCGVTRKPAAGREFRRARRPMTSC